MKAHLQYVNSKILSGAIASLALFILVSGSSRALGQTNTFPTSGNAGIGTTSPATPLDISNNQDAVVKLIRVNNPSTGASAQAAFSFFEGSTEKAKLAVNGSGASGYVGGAHAFLIWNFQNAPLVFGTTGSERMRIDGSGNVGIGTTTPGEFVHVRKDQNAATHVVVENTTTGASAQTDLQVKNNLGHSAQFGLYSSTTTTYGAIASGNAFAYTTSPAMVIMANNGTGIIKFATGGLSERMRIDASGNLGIGTTTPASALDVQAAAAGITTTSTTGTNRAYLATVNTGGSVLMGSESSVGQSLFNVGTLPYAAVFGTAQARPLQLVTNQTARLTIDSAGNVGIGTAPTAKRLQVSGDVNASGEISGGTIVAKYQDVAEWVHSSQQLSAGTVVVLDHTKSNQVIASSQAYDTRVAGVISLQPGITLGENGAGKVLVATTGRVRVKVDASAGPIQVGDLLVTSDKEGIAKKSEPLNLGGVQIHRPGTLIGKALEPLEKGTGEILVLLSLQ